MSPFTHDVRLDALVRLIEDQQFRFLRPASVDRGALLLAAGQIAAAPVRELLQDRGTARMRSGTASRPFGADAADLGSRDAVSCGRSRAPAA